MPNRRYNVDVKSSWWEEVNNMKKFLIGSLIVTGIAATGACLLAKKMELFRDDSVDYEKFESR